MEVPASPDRAQADDCLNRYLNMHERAPKWERWDHEVVGWVGDKLVPIPVNINTVNRLFDLAGAYMDYRLVSLLRALMHARDVQ